jgi:hypothetical protein
MANDLPARRLEHDDKWIFDPDLFLGHFFPPALLTVGTKKFYQTNPIHNI